MNRQLDALRLEFTRHAGRSLALPLAGAIVWTAVAGAGLVLAPRTAALVLLFGTGAIFPVGMALAALLRERLLDNPSPLAGLMGCSVLMVNLLWAVHLSLFAHDPTYVPLTLGIGLGLHWIVFGWIVGAGLGMVHAVVRTLLVTAAWWAFPEASVAAVGFAVVATYLVTIALMARRPLPASARLAA